jgi:UDP-N-acetyl-D-glucosamine dehydrogenase
MNNLERCDVTVRGLGFTGLATAVAAARCGFRVVGLDDSAPRVRQLTERRPGCGLTTVSEHELGDLLTTGTLRICLSSSGPSAGIHLICVPTPFGNGSGADLSALANALDSVAATLRDGDLVIVQSTCPPGTVEELIVPRLTAGAAAHVAYSPVRLDPGTEHASLTGTPRIVAGATPVAAELAVRFLRRIGCEVVPVGTVRTAELVKVFENTFRLVNISLVNELAALCRESDVDVGDVLAAAAGKPFGFLAHRPGPGAGGDCVPVAAKFFVVAARCRGVRSAVVDAAVAVNEAMPAVVLRRVERLLAGRGMGSLAGRRVLVDGVTYKPDVPNVHGSAAVRLIELLRPLADVGYRDPHVPELRLADGTMLLDTTADAHNADLVLLLTPHTTVDHEWPGVPVIDCHTGVPELMGCRHV